PGVPVRGLVGHHHTVPRRLSSFTSFGSLILRPLASNFSSFPHQFRFTVMPRLVSSGSSRPCHSPGLGCRQLVFCPFGVPHFGLPLMLAPCLGRLQPP